MYEFIKEVGVRNVEIDLGIGMLELLFKARFGEASLDSNIGLILKYL